MIKIENIIPLARKNLTYLQTIYRPDYEDLYSNFNNEVIRQIFSTLHYHYVELFTLMNESIPINKQANYFKAKPSKLLLKIIDLTNLLVSGLKNTEWAFSITGEYKNFIEQCRKFLRHHGGSPIPPNTQKAPIYYSRPIFVPEKSIKINYPLTGQRHLKKVMIGNGSYANVYRYRDDFYEKDFVIKVARKDLSKKDKERFRKEFDIMRSLSSPYVAEVYHYIEERDEFIMEYLDETLHDFITRNNGNQSFDFCARRLICMQILKGFKYIHSKKILHRDISPKNILIKHYDDIIVVKIADLGLAKTSESYLTNTETEIKGCCNDPQLRIEGFANYAIEHEIYALTIIIKYVLTGSLQTRNIKDPVLEHFVLTGTCPDSSKRFSSVAEMMEIFQNLKFSGTKLK